MLNLADQLRAHLVAQEEGMTIADICHVFDVTDRHARRAIHELREIGAVYSEPDGRRKVWKLSPWAGRRRIELSTSTAAALLAHRSLLAPIEGTTMGTDVAAFLDLLEDEFFPGRLAAGFFGTVAPIAEAILGRESVAVTHRTAGEGRPFLLRPYALEQSRGVLCVVGHASIVDQVRTIVCDGFTSLLRLSGASYETPECWRRTEDEADLPAFLGEAPSERAEPEEEDELDDDRWESTVVKLEVAR